MYSTRHFSVWVDFYLAAEVYPSSLATARGALTSAEQTGHGLTALCLLHPLSFCKVWLDLRKPFWLQQVVRGVTGEFRTHYFWRHKPALYRMSYSHQKGDRQIVEGHPKTDVVSHGIRSWSLRLDLIPIFPGAKTRCPRLRRLNGMYDK